MRFRAFMRRIIGTGEVQRLEFSEQDFRDAGIGYAPVAGMPVLESFALVNKWNAAQAKAEPRFVFYLEA